MTAWVIVGSSPFTDVIVRLTGKESMHTKESTVKGVGLDGTRKGKRTGGKAEGEE